jgi:hypothetical protein
MGYVKKKQIEYEILTDAAYVPISARRFPRETVMVMTLRSRARWIGGPLTVGAASVTALVLFTATANASGLYCGGGRGLTAEGAIQSAIADAENSASGDGLFTCELVGEPQVFESFNDPNFGHIFRAQVNMACS